MNKKLWIGCMSLIAVCLAATLALYWVTDLKEPLFLTHYYELLVFDDVTLELSYVTGYDDASRPVEVTFPQLDGTVMTVAGCETRTDGGGPGRYALHTVQVRLLRGAAEWTDDIVLQRADIGFSDGRQVSCDIGKIVLFPDGGDPGVKLFENNVSTSSNTGVSGVSMSFLDDVRVVRAPFALRDETDGILTLYANRVPAHLNPVTQMERTGDSRTLDDIAAFDKGEHVIFVSEYTIGNDDARQYNLYHIHRRVYLENAEGEVDCMVVYNMQYRPNLTGWELFRYGLRKGAH